MPRPIILGVVGDSASGKTTLTRGLVRLLGQEQVSHICLDDYHRYDRAQRAAMTITPRDPACNYMDIMAQHLKLLRGAGRAEAGLPALGRLLRPARVHGARPVPDRRGAARLQTEEMRRCFDIRVYLDPRRACAGAGRWCATAPARIHDQPGAGGARPSRARLRGLHPPPAPPCRHGGAVRSAAGADDEADAKHLDAHLLLRPGLPHPDLSDVVGDDERGLSLVGVTASRICACPGCSTRTALELEERIWEHMHSPAICARSGWASSPSAPAFIAPTRWRSSSCWCCITSSRRRAKSCPRWRRRRRRARVAPPAAGRPLGCGSRGCR